MALILLGGVILIIGYRLNLFFNYQYYSPFFLLIIPLFFCWLMSCLAEANRSPFDFAEGESELVSGFNTEYRRGLFAFLFLGEYGIMLFIRVFTEKIYFGVLSVSFLVTLFLIFFFIWIRGRMPRFRYDKLIYLA
jgi:NADH-ubiquinone oxidoreductase chain 1